MGVIMWDMEIFSANGKTAETVEVMVDTGAIYSQLPASLLHRLGIVPRRIQRLRLADGSVSGFPIGVATVRVSNRDIPTIVVFGNEDAPWLMGAYTLEGTGLAVDPLGERLIPSDVLPL